MTLSIYKKSKNLKIYVILLFNKLEPASGSRGGPRGAQGVPTPTAPQGSYNIGLNMTFILKFGYKVLRDKRFCFDLRDLRKPWIIQGCKGVFETVYI